MEYVKIVKNMVESSIHKAAEDLSFHKTYVYENKEYRIEDDSQDFKVAEVYQEFSENPENDLYFCMIIKEVCENNEPQLRKLQRFLPEKRKIQNGEFALQKLYGQENLNLSNKTIDSSTSKQQNTNQPTR